MPILERKIAHKMATLCSHITYPEFVLPLHKHAEYELILFFEQFQKINHLTPAEYRREINGTAKYSRLD